MDNKHEILDLARKRGLYPGSKKVRAFWLFEQGSLKYNDQMSC